MIRKRLKERRTYFADEDGQENEEVIRSWASAGRWCIAPPWRMIRERLKERRTYFADGDENEGVLHAWASAGR